MKKFILIPDSFKGTLSSKEICQILSNKINEVFGECEIISIPVADGGEGSVDCFLSAMGGKVVNVVCKNPFFEDMQSFYGITDNNVGIVEMATSAGLPLAENRKNPKITTTYGVGQQILHAVKSGVKEIIVGLGGSCTNDFGCGAACACGVKFFDKNGKSFIPVGQTLIDVAKIDLSGLDHSIKNANITAMCDIQNTPFGEFGAAKVFAAQKGANEQDIALLDEGVKHLCDLIKKDFGVDLSNLNGGAAAGAFGAGMSFFFSAKLKSGIETVLDEVGFDNIISGATAIFTGEGKIDGQSLMGKVVIGISQRAKKQNVPVIAIVGGAEGNLDGAYDKGVTSIFAINRLPQDFSISKNYSRENLSNTAGDILRLIKRFTL